MTDSQGGTISAIELSAGVKDRVCGNSFLPPTGTFLSMTGLGKSFGQGPFFPTSNPALKQAFFATCNYCKSISKQEFTMLSMHQPDGKR